MGGGVVDLGSRKIKSVIEKVDCYDIVLKSDFKIFLVK